MTRPNRSRVVLAGAAALAWMGALSCQAVYGDFRIDTSQLDAPPSAAGLCQTGQARCSGDTLETCAPDRKGWTALQKCSSPDLCNVEAETCRACTPGEYDCSDGLLRRCTDARTWDTTRCATPALCDAAEDRRSGTCKPPVCDVPGTYQCAGAELTRCAAGLDRWERVETCASEALCTAALMNGSVAAGQPIACPQPACAAGQFFCQNGQLGRCSPTFQTWDTVMTCAPAELCNVKTGDCSPCAAGEHACSGAELKRCNASGSWDRVQVCASAALCDATLGRCEAPTCDSPGSVRCRETLELEYCQSTFQWARIATCAAGPLCDADERRCHAPACRRGNQRCRGAVLERCREDVSGWDAVQTCATGETCNPEIGCAPSACATGMLRCNDRYLEECMAGEWQRRERCVTRELCDATAGVCEPPACGAPLLPEFECRGQILNRCKPGRDGFEERETCASAADCDAATGRCG